ncbi:hypothetical protein K3495_g16434 [Podosphaera aphanis]|nr:hypothetical protein K3495_g16434 [Podosphaera aphanis]
MPMDSMGYRDKPAYQLLHLVRFKGYGAEEDLSIPATEAEGFLDLVKEFHDMNPSEPKPSDIPPKERAKRSRKPRRSSAKGMGG